MLNNSERDIIFDRFGEPLIRILKNNWIVTFDGDYLGILKNNTIYNLDGSHVGWYEGGILRDLDGETVGFGAKPTDTPRPFLPYRGFIPFRGFVGVAPWPAFPAWPNLKPIKSYGWSDFSPITLFGDR